MTKPIVSPIDPTLSGLLSRIDTLERAMAALQTKITTRRLEVIDPDGHPHIIAEAGQDFATFTVAARPADHTDDGPAVTLAASEEFEQPYAFAVSRLGDTDKVVGHIGTDHPYGERLPL